MEITMFSGVKMTLFQAKLVSRFLLIWLATGLITLFTAPCGVLALSDEEYKKFMAESGIFRDAETELNTVWKQVMERLTPEQGPIVRQAQVDWVKYIRDQKAKELAKTNKLSMPEAYSVVTRERISQLRIYFASATDQGSADKIPGGLAGKYSSGMGFLSIRELAGGRIEFDLVTEWPPQRCAGEIKKGVAVVKGRQAVYTDPECPKLVFTFSDQKVEVEEADYCGYHGLNCRFDGTYQRTK